MTSTALADLTGINLHLVQFPGESGQVYLFNAPRLRELYLPIIPPPEPKGFTISQLVSGYALPGMHSIILDGDRFGILPPLWSPRKDRGRRKRSRSHHTKPAP